MLNLHVIYGFSNIHAPKPLYYLSVLEQQHKVF